MALSAVVTLSSASTVVGRVIRAFITVSNSGPNAVALTYIIPQIKQTGNILPVDSSCFSAGPVAQPGNIPVPAGGSEIFTMDVAFHTPSLIIDGSIQTTYDVGCLIGNSVDISTVTPTPATCSVVGVNPQA